MHRIRFDRTTPGFMTTVLGILLISYLLIGFEAIIPGGVLGILGFAGLCFASYHAHLEFGGWFAPSLTFLLGGLGAIALVLAEFKWLSKSPLGKKLFLSQTVKGSSNSEERDPGIVGQTGESITELHPEGLVRICDKEYDAFCEEGFLPKGSKVLVTGMDDFRIRIRPQ